MEHRSRSSATLYSTDGRRKYLTPAERVRFIDVASRHPRAELGTLCLLIAFTGCRVSEALSTTSGAIEITECFVAIRSLKKRGGVHIRTVPLPDDLIAHLNHVHGLNAADPDARLWPWSRSRAWFLIKQVMHDADIASGQHATAKGLRHGFGINAVRSGVPLNLVQRWLGHASIATTAIYTDALGAEERELAARMWQPSRLGGHAAPLVECKDCRHR